MFSIKLRCYVCCCGVVLSLVIMIPTGGANHLTAGLNFRKCKLTHSGIEYRGNVFTTKSKSLCRPWTTIGTEPDASFADGSRVLAKNYCRNPNGTQDDPWCYTYGKDGSTESCALPLCNSKKCRVTGPGAEYGGDANTTKSGYGCAPWTAIPPQPRGPNLTDSRFPDGGRAAAGNRCRNPTGDPGGPWCYVTVDGTSATDYCETFGCDDACGGWTLVNGGGGGGESSAAHGHYTAMDTLSSESGDGLQAATFELKAWDPAAAALAGGPFRMRLTAYPTSSGSDAFEVPVPAEAFARSAREPVRMELSWRNGFVALTTGGREPRELLSFELDAAITPVLYASFVGGDPRDSPVAVRFPRCSDSGRTTATVHEEHVTNSLNAYRIFPLKKTIVASSELSFSVRAVVSASVTYYTAPVKQTPCLTIVFAARPVQQIKIVYKGQSTGEEQLIFQQTYDTDIISYWHWHQYTITIVDKTLQVLAVHQSKEPATVLLNIVDSKLRFFHWFAIGSETIAHWTLYCSGSKYYPLPKATLPECIVSKSGENYRGTQWVTEDGEPCVPWNVTSVRKTLKESALIDGSYVKAKNYCRNPTKDPNGPYCFVTGSEGEGVEKRSCQIQRCRNTRCHVTGIATDYLGALNKTVSNRTCLKWIDTGTGGGKHDFPDGSVSRASNYCRNPTKSPTGAWCYVDGPAKTDLCDVAECAEDGGDDRAADTLLLAGADAVQWMYALPEWRNAPGLRAAVKRWTPGARAGSVSWRFRRARDPPSTHDLLRLGHENVTLFRVRDDYTAAAAAAELVYPHLVMASRWTELFFEFVDDGEGEPTAAVVMSSAADGQIFRWNAAIEEAAANDSDRIVFVGVSATGDGYSGVRFPTQECLVYCSESRTFSAYLPINVRTNTSLANANNEITFRMRHTGVTRIALVKMTLSEPYVLEIEGDRAELSREGKRARTLESFKSKTAGDIISASSWTRIILSWSENVLTMDYGGAADLGRQPLRWTVDRPPLLARYFSVANRGGRTTWTANCDERWRRPPDVDGPPRDGGWSAWGEWERCTKACGGGTGVRRRRCDSPRPNMAGRPCAGPDTAEGACNRHECGQLSASAAAAVRRMLAAGAHNLAVAAGEGLSMSCDRHAAELVHTDSPRARFAWLRNGKPVRPSPSAARTGRHVDACALVISACTTQDSGVYAFTAQPPDSERVVLKIIALSVYDKPIPVYIGDKISVRCNAVTLGYIFKKLSQKWTVNNSYIVKDYGLNSLASIDADKITIENEKFQGIWKCVSKSNEINSSWVTNIMIIKVIGISTTWTRIMQDSIVKTIFWHASSSTTIIWICTTFIFSLCVFGFVFAYCIDRAKMYLRRKKPVLRQEKVPHDNS